MTAYPDPYRQAPNHRPSRTDEPVATFDDSPRVAGAVPITVWRLDDRDDDQPTAGPGSGFASRLARRLILVYTSQGQTVVDLDSDIHLHRAATVTGRAYLALTEPACLADLDPISEPVGLVTFRWPRTTTPAHAEQVADLFAACRLVISAEGCVVAAVRPTTPAKPGHTFADHEHALRAAAEVVGLTYVLQIVAVSAPGEGDQFLYYATEAEASDVVSQAMTTSSGEVLHIDLLVFATGSESP